jgi:hypothetical protein
LKEAHPSRGDAVNIGRGKVAASVTGDVGIAEVVGKNKDDVRRPGDRLGICTDAIRRERSRPEGGICTAAYDASLQIGVASVCPSFASQ